mgnify:CR=1 FL=1
MPDSAVSLPSPPRGVAATLHTLPQGARIDVPPAGLWRGSFGLIIFGPALVLVAVVAVARIIMLEGGIAPWVLTWFILLGLIGVGMTFAAQLLGLRATQVACDGETLSLVWRTVLGTRRVEVQRAAVDRVAVGEAPFTSRNRAIVRLEVHLKDGGRHVAMTARPEAEVRWAADVVGRLLGLPKTKRP